MYKNTKITKIMYENKQTINRPNRRGINIVQ